MIDLIPLATGFVGIVIGFGTCAAFTTGAIHDATGEAENARIGAETFHAEAVQAESLRRQAVEAMIELNASNERMAEQLEAYRAKEAKRHAANSARVSKSNRTRYAKLREQKNLIATANATVGYRHG